MEKLNDNLLMKIFEQLEISEILKCRLICRRWKDVIGQMMIEELVLDDDKVHLDESIIYRKFTERTQWFNTELPYSNIIKVKKDFDLLSFLQSSILNLNELKRLRINSEIDYNKFKISNLSKYSKLEHLEIGWYNGVDENEELSLPELQTFYFRSIGNPILNLNTPKLHTLSSLDLEQVRLKQRDSIRNLETEFLDEGCLFFKNVENLMIYDTKITEKCILDQLINLKRMRINPDDAQSDFYYECIENLVKNLLDEIEIIKRNEIEIILDNRKIIDYFDIIDLSSESDNACAESFQLLCLEDFNYDFFDF